MKYASWTYAPQYSIHGEEIISMLLQGVREWFYNRLTRYSDKRLWLMPLSHFLVVHTIIVDALLYPDPSSTPYKYRRFCWLSFHAEIQNDNMRIYFLKPTDAASFSTYHLDCIPKYVLRVNTFLSWSYQDFRIPAMVVPKGWWEKYCQILSVITKYFLHMRCTSLVIEIFKLCAAYVAIYNHCMDCSGLYGSYGYIFTMISYMCAFYTHINHIFNMLAQS